MKLDVLPNTHEAPWYQEQGLQFTCTQCGNCCTGAPGYVWISEVEIERLAAHFQLPEPEIRRRFCRKIGDRWSLKEQRNPRGDYDCIFLKEVSVAPSNCTNSTDPTTVIQQTRQVCTAYEARPLQCRTWPFWPEVVKTPSAWRGAAKRCHGIGQGRVWSANEIAALRDARDWPADAPGST